MEAVHNIWKNLCQNNHNILYILGKASKSGKKSEKICSLTKFLLTQVHNLCIITVACPADRQRQFTAAQELASRAVG